MNPIDGFLTALASPGLYKKQGTAPLDSHPVHPVFLTLQIRGF